MIFSSKMPEERVNMEETEILLQMDHVELQSLK